LKPHEAEQRVDLRRRFADGRADLVRRGQQRVDLERLAGLQVLQHRRLERAQLPRPPPCDPHRSARWGKPMRAPIAAARASPTGRTP